MSPGRKKRINRDLELMRNISNYYWGYMEQHIDHNDDREINIALFHLYLVFGVKVTFDELIHIIYAH